MKFILLPATAVLLMSYQNCALPFSQGFATDQATSLSSVSVAQQAMSILTTKCASCHGGGASQGGITNIDDPSSLVSQGLVVYGSPSTSSLVAAIANGSMPKTGALVSSSELATIERWIAAPNGATAPTPTPAPAVQPTYSSIQSSILAQQCLSCHSPGGQRSQTDFTSYATLMSSGVVTTGNPAASALYDEVANGNMPLYEQVLTAQQMQAISDWITAGAANN